MDKSCGNCKHFRETGFGLGWGGCDAPLPAWALGSDEFEDRSVCADGGEYDLASKCEVYEPREEDERCG